MTCVGLQACQAGVDCAASTCNVTCNGDQACQGGIQTAGIPVVLLHRRVPYGVALAAAYVSEFVADVLTHRSPAATVTGVKLTRRRMHFDARRSLDELGLQPRPVAGTLAETVAKFRRLGWLA